MARRTRRLLFLLLGLGVALLLLAPTLAGRLPPVRDWIAARAAGALGRGVRMGSLDAGWTDGVRIGGLTLSGPGGDFAAPLLQAESIRLETPIHRILLGNSELTLVVKGARIGLEERGGDLGIEDLRRRFEAEPAAGEAERSRPLRILFEDSAVVLRMGRVYAVESIRGSLSSGDGGWSAELDGSALVDGEGGPFHATARSAGGEMTASLRARGVALAGLGALLRRPIEGRADIDATGTVSTAGESLLEVKASCAGLRAERLHEANLDLDATLRRSAGRVRIENLRLRSASERIRLDGSGEIPVAASAGPSAFRFEGSADLPFLFGLLGDDPCEGRLEFDLSGSSEGDILRVQGSASGKGLRFRDPALRAAGEEELGTRLDVEVDLDRKRATIRSIEARAPFASLDVSGAAQYGEEVLVDLSGSGRFDLARLFRLARPIAGLREGTALAGTADVRLESLRRGRGGSLEVRAGVDVAGFQASGFSDAPLPPRRLLLGLDATREGDGDRLVVRSARLDSLSLEADLSGLRRPPLRIGSGRVEGSVLLDPLLLRFLGVRGVDDASGTATVSLAAAPEGEDLRISGHVEAKELRISGSALPAGRFQRARARVDLDLRRRGTRHEGTLALRLDPLEARFDRIAVDEKAGPLAARGRIEIRDLEGLLRELGGGLDLGGLAVAGAATVDVDAGREEGRWSGEVGLESAALRVRGPGGEAPPTALRARLSLAETPSGPEVRNATATLPGWNAHLSFRGRPESFGCDLAIGLEALPALVPDAASLRPEGRVRFRGTVRRGDSWRVAGDFTAAPLSLDAGGRRLGTATLALPLDLTAGPGEAVLAPTRLTSDFGTVRLGGSFRPGSELLVDLGGRLDLGKLLVGGERGEVEFEARGRMPLGSGRGRGSVVGRVASAGVRSEDLAVADALGEFEILVDREGTREPRMELSFHSSVREVRIGGRVISGLDTNQIVRGELSGRGREEGFSIRANVAAEEIRLDEIPVRGVRGSLSGTWRNPDLDDLSGIRASGRLAFDSTLLRSFSLSSGGADVTIEGRRLEIADFSASCNDGTAKGAGAAEFGETETAWSGSLRLDSVALDERFQGPLGFLLPILRLKDPKREGQRLKGTLAGEIRLGADGTSVESLRRSLEGDGRLLLTGVEVTESLLLPLLTMRLDRALLGAPYRFQNLDVGFRVAGGRVRSDPLRIAGVPFALEIEGSAGLDGSLDYLVKGTLLPVPLRIRGTFDQPKVSPTIKGIFR